jgi:uncharacterized membrane protein YqjE
MIPVTSAHQHPNGRPTDGGLPPVPSIPLSEDKGSAGTGDQSIGGLVRDATTHLSTLVRAEVELARTEITAEVKKGLKGSVFLIVALTVLLLLLPFLFTTLALVLSIWLPEWAGFGIITFLMLVVAGLFGLLGYRKMRRIRAPQRTLESMRGTATALRRSRDAEPESL